MKYYIIQVCCFDCNNFINFFITDDDYYDFISSLEDYKDYYYYIYSSNCELLNKLGGYDI